MTVRLIKEDSSKMEELKKYKEIINNKDSDVIKIIDSKKLKEYY
jgi:hypothetical protein